MGLDNAVLGYIEEKVDELMNLQLDWLESSPSKKTDIRMVIDAKFDGMIVNLKYWGENRLSNLDVRKQEEETQKLLKEFGYPEKIV